jgi:hypothetical protein
MVSIIKLVNDYYSESDLIFPQLSNVLKFCNLNLIISKLDNYPSLLNYDNALDIESIQEICIHPQPLLNLQSFSYLPKITKSLTKNIEIF